MGGLMGLRAYDEKAAQEIRGHVNGHKLYRSEKLFDSVVYPGLGHGYVPEMWEKMLNWIDGNLREAK
jgi:hypothetical protein